MWPTLPRVPMYHLPYLRHTGEGHYPVAPSNLYRLPRPTGLVHVRAFPQFGGHVTVPPPLPPPTPSLPPLIPRRHVKPLRPRNLDDGDLEWDNYDLCSEGSRANSVRHDSDEEKDKIYSSDSDLEWDDFDLQNGGDDSSDAGGSLALDSLYPLLRSITRKPSPKGTIPLGAIQVKKLPRITCTFAGLSHVPEEFCFEGRSRNINKDLLTLTSRLNGYDSDIWENFEEDFPTTKLGKTFSNESLNSDISTVSTQESGYRSGSTAKSRDTPDLTDTSYADSYGEGTVVEYSDRFPNYNIYELSPQYLDSPLSASLTDLSDATLCKYPSSLLHKSGRLLSKGKRSAKKRKRKPEDKGEEDVAEETEDDKKSKRLAPNYFVAIQVSNPEIHDNLRNVQQSVMKSDEKLKDAMIPIPTLHLTVMVMHIANDEELERAKDALRTCHALLTPQFEDNVLEIPFSGLGHFNNQVMFARIQDGDHVSVLYDIAETVEKVYNQYNIVSTGERGFKPHLTVMKLSRAPSLRRKGVRRIKSEYYRQFNADYFGSQVVKGLQLCSINKPKTDDGYYYFAEEIAFQTGQQEAEKRETVSMTRIMVNDIVDDALQSVEADDEDDLGHDEVSMETKENRDTDVQEEVNDGNVKDVTMETTEADKEDRIKGDENRLKVTMVTSEQYTDKLDQTVDDEEECEK
ncbi:uncharacterized protein LOC144446045 isoform X2 [Glandiceps talaboti]